MSDKHECPAPHCGVQLPMHIFACTDHWRKIPQNLKSALSRAWRNVDNDVAEYLRVRGECVAFLQTAFDL